MRPLKRGLNGRITILGYLQLDASMLEMLEMLENAPEMHLTWNTEMELLMAHRCALNTRYTKQLTKLYRYRKPKRRSKRDQLKMELEVLVQTIMNCLKLDAMMCHQNVNAEKLMMFRSNLNLQTTDQLNKLYCYDSQEKAHRS